MQLQSELNIYFSFGMALFCLQLDEGVSITPLQVHVQTCVFYTAHKCVR